MDAHRIGSIATLFIFEILFLNLAVTLVEKRAREMVTHYLWRMSLSKTKKKFFLNLFLSFSVSILPKTFPNIAVPSAFHPSILSRKSFLYLPMFILWLYMSISPFFYNFYQKSKQIGDLALSYSFLLWSHFYEVTQKWPFPFGLLFSFCVCQSLPFANPFWKQKAKVSSVVLPHLLFLSPSIFVFLSFVFLYLAQSQFFYLRVSNVLFLFCIEDV